MSVKPFGVFVERHNRSADRHELELTEELREELRDRARLNARRALQVKPDPVGEMLECTYFVQNKPFPMSYQGRSVSVTRFYPEKNVAVDVFETKGPVERREIAFKRAVFKRSGVAYAAMSCWADELGDLLRQVKTCR